VGIKKNFFKQKLYHFKNTKTIKKKQFFKIFVFNKILLSSINFLKFLIFFIKLKIIFLWIQSCVIKLHYSIWYHFRESIINTSVSMFICVNDCRWNNKIHKRIRQLIFVILQIINNVKSYNNFYFFFKCKTFFFISVYYFLIIS